MKKNIIDYPLYWRLPGPRRFVNNISEVIMHARMLWVNLPLYPLCGIWDGVEEGVRDAHIDNVIKLKISDGTDIAREIGVHFDKIGLTASELALHTANRRSAVILLPLNEGGVTNCSIYADEFAHAIDSNNGNITLILVCINNENTVIHEKSTKVKTISFDGGLSLDEMDAYVAIRMLDRSGPGSTRLTRAIVSEFAGFDLELAEQIMTFDEDQIVNIISNLSNLMGDSPLRWRHNSWLYRTHSVNAREATHVLHDKYLAEHGPINTRTDALRRIKRRYWNACLKTISPWLEERRKAVISIFLPKLKVIASANNGKIPRNLGLSASGKNVVVFIDPLDLEYNNIVGLSRSKQIEPNNACEKLAISVCRIAKKVRDEIAHLRAPEPNDVSDLIKAMDQLFHIANLGSLQR